MATPISSLVQSNMFQPKLGGNSLGITSSTPTVSSGGTNLVGSFFKGVPGSVQNPTFTPNATTSVAGYNPTQYPASNPNNISQNQSNPIQNQGTLTKLANGGVTAGSGSYAGNPKNNPYYTQPTKSTGGGTAVSNGMGYAENGAPIGNNQNSMITPGGGTATPGSYVAPTPQYQNASSNIQTQGIPGVWQTVLNNLANTQPSSATSNAYNYLQGQAQGNNPAQQNINTLTNLGQNASPAVNTANQNFGNFMSGSGQLLNEIKSDPGLAAAVSTGIASNVAPALATTGSTLAQQVQNALTGQGQQIGAATAGGSQQLTGQNQQITAANNAGQLGNTAQQNQITAQNALATAPGVAPTLGSYGQTYYQYGNQNTGGQGNNLDPQTYAKQLAQQVINGSMTLDQAQSALSYAGTAGNAFLQQAITSANPNFNFNQAATNSAVQGQLGPQTALAQGEIQNLMTAMKNAPQLQQTTIPAINAVSSWINNFLGNPNSKALSDARSAAESAVSTALATAYGGTPSSFDALINGWFPPNGTPQQIQAGLQQFTNLMTVRANAYNSPGSTPQAGTSGNSSSGSSQGWASLGD